MDITTIKSKCGLGTIILAAKRLGLVVSGPGSDQDLAAMSLNSNLSSRLPYGSGIVSIRGEDGNIEISWNNDDASGLPGHLGKEGCRLLQEIAQVETARVMAKAGMFPVPPDIVSRDGTINLRYVERSEDGKSQSQNQGS